MAPLNVSSSARPHLLRSGTAARLAGLPVTTLRVWERRYDVVAGARTDSGQRGYTNDDVVRLRLLRQLTLAGHPIGTIATLGMEALQALQALGDGSSLPGSSGEPGMLRVVVVGRSAAHALEAVPGCRLLAVHDDLDRAEAATPPGATVDLLLVRLASLQPLAVDRVLALGAAWGAAATWVVYGYGTKASADALRAAGVRLRRGPLAGRELAQWVREARPVAPALPRADDDSGWRVEPRRFDDDTLARMADAPSPVACECLRHMTEIVSQLAGFERYSQDCTHTSPADVALHRRLGRTAGAARTMFEEALQRVLAEVATDAGGTDGEATGQ